MEKDISNLEVNKDLDSKMVENQRELELEIREVRDVEMEVQNVIEVIEPKVGMMFETEFDAHRFYVNYARTKGFGVSIANSKKKEGIKHWIQFSCHKGGVPKKGAHPLSTHPTAKTDCKATIKLSRQFDDKWKVNSIHLEHNHAMDPENTKYLRCYRKHAEMENETKQYSRAEIKLNQRVDSFGRRAGEKRDRTWMEKDDNLRIHELKGSDAQEMMRYFQRMQAENNDFFYSIHFDEENRLTSFFWADARSREAYKEFGDAVTFDTTYLDNKFNIPFALFIGVNHHGHSILFGCGYVAREDTDSFVWLFDAWLACMSNHHPKSIITAQNRDMQIAISHVLPHTRHRWCLWHIMKKILEKFRPHTEYEQIQYAVNDVVYDSLTIEDFEENWGKLIEDYKIEDSDWLRSLYDERNEWVPVFVKDSFWAGMPGTQQNDNVNAFFDGYIFSKTMIKDFAEQYNKALFKKVENEEEADAKSMDSQYRNMSPYRFEHQYHDAYTVSKFKQFQKQLSDLIACELEVGPVVDGIEHFIVEQYFEAGKTNKFTKTLKFVVYFNERTGETNCVCRMFESEGMVCAHMLRIWKKKKLSIVPEQYILKRWRKNILRSYTKVRLSYTNWQRKPEFRRYDELQALFYEAADGVIFSEVRTDWLKRILAQAIEANKQPCPINILSAIPTFTNVGDSSQGFPTSVNLVDQNEPAIDQFG